MTRRSVSVALALIAAGGCRGREPRSHPANPLGWPGKTLSFAGFEAASSGVFLAREAGRLVQALGEALESPALLAEGTATLDRPTLRASLRSLSTGCGGTVTALLNLPFFWHTGGRVDIGRDAEAVNQALVHLEGVQPETWRLNRDDAREELFPRGTRVRARGKGLLWEVPGRGVAIQACEQSPLFQLVQWIGGTSFHAQERSWGFVVRGRGEWESTATGSRAKTIVHEFYHQEAQIRQAFRGWSIVYWPAYGASFASTGWHGHWAEDGGSLGAAAVGKGLRGWSPGD